ncbi:molybdenum cofactor guanylyltransferase [Gloeobacter kilaueensis]|uniref:molybdenum cofactor guanylyltransferase n=1 Tax=Gloeobacter kilaueensis TaxID=1416614 RepID=UPI00059C4B62|nr:molybdenum cofactor guanylyltransferase [Gloeobacter kilaueensis]
MQSSPSQSSPVAVLILAGGQSSRMGQDKALIDVEGTPMIRRVRDAARAALGAAVPVWGIAPLPERYRESLSECRWIEDHYAEGPFVAFLQALPHIQSEWLLLLACDLPALQPAVLNRWYRSLAQLPHSTLAALPRSDKGWEALCGFYHKRCFTSAVQFLGQGGRSFQGWLEQVPVFELVCSEQEMLLNCNTPEDLARVTKTSEEHALS